MWSLNWFHFRFLVRRNHNTSRGQNWRTDKTSETSEAFTRQMAYYETKIRQEIIISWKSPRYVNNVTFCYLSPESWIGLIWAQKESLWCGKNSSRFTCEMADFEWQIGHELLIYRNYPCHIFWSYFWRCSNQYRKSIRSQHGKVLQEIFESPHPEQT